MKIKAFFLGGTADGRNLTGSCTLLVIQQRKKTTRIMIDAGLVQSGFNDSLIRNRKILEDIDPRDIDYVILTHSHTDHGGRLPLLVKYGFGRTSRIICTKATSRLLPVMLGDSAKIQLLEARTRGRMDREKKKDYQKGKDYCSDQRWLGNHDRYQAQKKKNRPVKKSIEPLYSTKDALETCRLIKNDGFPYEEWIKLEKDISLKLYPSGHVLGGAICVIRVSNLGKDTFLGFSGDLGREDGVILPPPKMVEEPIKYWFVESTYGGETHPKREDEIARLNNLVKNAVAKKRKIIIPSFVLERAQEIIYLLSRDMSQGRLPSIPIYLDSPMAAKITDIYATSWELKMFEGQETLNFNPFDIKQNNFLKIIADPKESEQLLKTDGPYIVVAGSGMCDAGRIRNYLRQELSNPNSIVCLVGYMAENSLGRRLKDGWPVVKMNRDSINIQAEIVGFDGFSAHADSSFLTGYTIGVMNNNPDERDKKVIILHGEGKNASLFKHKLMENLPNNGWLNNIVIPELGGRMELYMN